MSPIRYDVFMKRIFKGHRPRWICFNFCLIPNEEFWPVKQGVKTHERDCGL